jgi:transglutaminase-like putative cysteine protease
MKRYLVSSEHIDWKHGPVSAKAHELAQGAHSDETIAKRSFEFVRDRIHHSWDARMNPVTCRASDVLRFGTGFCFAKSHLLAALLRANGIPAGLCYQRLAVDGAGPPYCLHGLNAVHLRQYGWYRIDARGNKPGIATDFCPPREQLAFTPLDPLERDFPEIWPDPLPVVVQVLTTNVTVGHVFDNLPDVEVMARHSLVDDAAPSEVATGGLWPRGS